MGDFLFPRRKAEVAYHEISNRGKFLPIGPNLCYNRNMVKRDFLTTILLVLSSMIIMILLRLFVFATHTLSEADANSYLNKGDRILLLKEEQPDYGDFVLYRIDGNAYVGRVMAKGGDKATFSEDVFYRNQDIVDQPFLRRLEQAYVADIANDLPFTEDFSLDSLMNQQDATVPQDNFLILNDNRQNRADSRQFGLIPRSKIDGVLTFRLYPLDKFGFLTTE